MTGLQIKICGITTAASLAAALDAGATMVGLVFHPASPRFVTLETAADLAARAEGRALSVALLVDPDDATVTLIREAVNPRLLQLHGRETPERVREIRALAERPVIKALGVATGEDLAAVPDHARAADLLLLDAKPPAAAAYPGGHGQRFDWSLLAALRGGPPFLLSGGLDPGNVAGAIHQVRALGAPLLGVDVSSGVERTRGVKDEAVIHAFVAAARAAAPGSPSP